MTKGNGKVTGTSREVARTKPEARSRVTNGKGLFLEDVDGRTAYARRYRDVLAQLRSDLGGGLSEAEDMLARRAATLAVWCEMTEARLMTDGEFDLAAFNGAANTLRRLLTTIGLERRARDITPALDSYLSAGE